ncbi:MAG: sterol desaturase family protein [Rhodothermales bacterium]|nr:sterol desaturase family protein [Rhodothermales bacterium]
MEKYVEIFWNGYTGYARYLWHEVTHPGWHSYFWWLLGVSAFFFLLEIVRPWRKEQPKFRRDFWLDFFYMFFNFFLFSLVIYNAASDVVVNLFTDGLAAVGIPNLVAIEVSSWPVWAQLGALFVVRDFIQWNVHRLLHRVPWLWEFHKVHHSVKEMGFAAHLRFHWMENVVYRVLEYVPLAMIGFGIDDFFIVHIFTLAVGHFNHSNLRVPLGPLGYVLNNPQMHIWHHARQWPEDRPYGINFGLTLSVWDYLFGTAAIPHDGRDIELGFPGDEDFPQTFVGQNLHGLARRRKEQEAVAADE